MFASTTPGRWRSNNNDKPESLPLSRAARIWLPAPHEPVVSGRDEADNIAEVFRRGPNIGKTGLIFVEGNPHHGTYETIEGGIDAQR